jgi:hypothetical protein
MIFYGFAADVAALIGVGNGQFTQQGVKFRV